jgi:hypothetical protein
MSEEENSSEEVVKKPVRRRRTTKPKTVEKSLSDFVVSPQEIEAKKEIEAKEQILSFCVSNKYIVRFPNQESKKMFCVIHHEEKENYAMIFESEGQWSASSVLNNGSRQKLKNSDLTSVLSWLQEQLSTEFKRKQKIEILKEFRKNR